MTNREIAITKFVRSRGCAFLLILAAVSFAAVSNIRHPEAPNLADLGVAFTSSNLWLPSTSLSVVTACCFNLLIAALMVIINRRFNVLRTVSITFAGLFMLMQSAAPRLTGHLCDGLFLGAGILLAMGLMFSCYMQRDATPRVFLAFFIIGCGMLWRYSWIVFVPAFTGGLAQMRIFSFRTLLAAGMGLLTPLWIAWGLGLTDPLQWTMPDLGWNIRQLIDHPLLQHSLAVGLMSLGAGALLGIANLFKILSYNAVTRAYNGLLLTVSMTVGLLAVADWQHLSLYLTLLNICTAVQAGHFLKINIQRRGYLPITAMIVIYTALFISTMFIPTIWG